MIAVYVRMPNFGQILEIRIVQYMVEQRLFDLIQ